MVTLPHLQYNLSKKKNFWWYHERVLWHHNLFSKCSYLRKTEAANFAHMIKTSIKLIKTTFKNLMKVKRLVNYLSKDIFKLYFLTEGQIAVSVVNC